MAAGRGLALAAALLCGWAAQATADFLSDWKAAAARGDDFQATALAGLPTGPACVEQGITVNAMAMSQNPWNPSAYVITWGSTASPSILDNYAALNPTAPPPAFNDDPYASSGGGSSGSGGSGSGGYNNSGDGGSGYPGGGTGYPGDGSSNGTAYPYMPPGGSATNGSSRVLQAASTTSYFLSGSIRAFLVRARLRHARTLPDLCRAVLLLLLASAVLYCFTPPTHTHPHA
jgi:hypothetical protein